MAFTNELHCISTHLPQPPCQLIETCIELISKHALPRRSSRSRIQAFQVTTNLSQVAGRVLLLFIKLKQSDTSNIFIDKQRCTSWYISLNICLTTEIV